MLADVLGALGVSLILTAYFLNLKNKLSSQESTYLLLNLVGAGFACASSMLLNSIPFTILEGTWFIVSAWSLWKTRNT